ncbi:MAG: FAD-dependent oxidoreductase, partial [Actinobacteria bacterium]|nr:FAD-dependent oxidoreductase [Actinomycetota bacterium]
MSEVDVAIVGGGAAGMVAALRAARNPNLTVVVFEKSTAE